MDQASTYFNGEKFQCMVGIAVSISIILLSAWFIYLQKPFYKGIAYACIPLSLLLLAVCIGIVLRTPRDMARVNAYESTRLMQVDELPRMEKVMKSFNLIIKVEIVVFAIGVILAIFFWNNDLVRGIALGLIIQSSLLYLFDHMAAARAERYVDFLQSLG